MSRTVAPLRRLQGDAGMTLIELIVATAVAAVVAVIVGSVLVSASTATVRLQRSSEAIDDARAASSRLDRELRSASCIAQPAENTAGGTTLVFDTLADGVPHRVIYKVSGSLLLREEGGDEQVLVDSVGATTTPFKLLATPLRTVEVRLPITSANGGTFVLETTIAGRNAWRTCGS